jgi:hypothetical protein
MVKLPFPKFQEYNCTATGQVTTALSGRTIYQINRERANAILPKKTAVSSSTSLKTLQSSLKIEISAITGMNTAQQSSPVSPLPQRNSGQAIASRLLSFTADTTWTFPPGSRFPTAQAPARRCS